MLPFLASFILPNSRNAIPRLQSALTFFGCNCIPLEQSFSASKNLTLVNKIRDKRQSINFTCLSSNKPLHDLQSTQVQ